jgi:hypothetical protein
MRARYGAVPATIGIFLLASPSAGALSVRQAARDRTLQYLRAKSPDYRPASIAPRVETCKLVHDGVSCRGSERVTRIRSGWYECTLNTLFRVAEPPSKHFRCTTHTPSEVLTAAQVEAWTGAIAQVRRQYMYRELHFSSEAPTTVSCSGTQKEELFTGVSLEWSCGYSYPLGVAREECHSEPSFRFNTETGEQEEIPTTPVCTPVKAPMCNEAIHYEMSYGDNDYAGWQILASPEAALNGASIGIGCPPFGRGTGSPEVFSPDPSFPVGSAASIPGIPYEQQPEGGETS